MTSTGKAEFLSGFAKMETGKHLFILKINGVMQVTLFCMSSNDDFSLEVLFTVSETGILKAPLAEQSDFPQITQPLHRWASHCRFCSQCFNSVNSSFLSLNPCWCCHFDFRLLEPWAKQVPAQQWGSGCVSSQQQGHSFCQSQCSKPLSETLPSAPGLARTNQNRNSFSNKPKILGK